MALRRYSMYFNNVARIADRTERDLTTEKCSGCDHWNTWKSIRNIMWDVEEEERYGYLSYLPRHTKTEVRKVVDNDVQILSIIKRHRPISSIVPRQGNSVGEGEVNFL